MFDIAKHASGPDRLPEEPCADFQVFVARQPILDSKLDVYAYELLYRSSLKNACESVSNRRATTDVISNTLLTIGMEQLVGGKPAFVNFDRELLLGGLAELLPSKIVIEVLETVTPDAEVISRCRELRRQGFKIALDDVTDLKHLGQLIEVADFVKVDFRATDGTQQQALAWLASRRGVRLLAEKVETGEEFERAIRLGYTLVQGYFFAKPKIIHGSNIPPSKMVFLRLLREINQPEPDLKRIEDALKHEPALVYKLLRYMNSASFGLAQPIGSVQHALTLLGTEQIRKWIGLLALTGLSERSPAFLAVAAIMRARFCELIATAAGLRNRSSDLFLLGMLSLFEAILRKPLQEIIENIDLNDDIRNTLLNRIESENAVGTIFSLVTAYEAGLWNIVDDCVKRLGISIHSVSGAYAESVQWAETLDKA